MVLRVSSPLWGSFLFGAHGPKSLSLSHMKEDFLQGDRDKQQKEHNNDLNCSIRVLGIFIDIY